VKRHVVKLNARGAENNPSMFGRFFAEFTYY